MPNVPLVAELGHELVLVGAAAPAGCCGEGDIVTHYAVPTGDAVSVTAVTAGGVGLFTTKGTIGLTASETAVDPVLRAKTFHS